MVDTTSDNPKPPLVIDTDKPLEALDRALVADPEREGEEARGEVSVPGWLCIAALFAGWLILAVAFWFFVIWPANGC